MPAQTRSLQSLLRHPGSVFQPQAVVASAQTLRANQLRLYRAAFAYGLLEILRCWGLAGTRLARAQCGTLRLKLLKIGVRIRVGVRAVRLSFDEGFPEAGLFRQVLERVQNLPQRC